MFIFAKIINQYVGRRTYVLALVTSAVVVLIIALLLENSAGYLRGLQTAQLKCGGCPCSPEVSIEPELRANLNFIHAKIGIGFLASLLGLSLRRVFGFFLSLAGLIWVAVTYIAWHISTSRFVAEYVTEQAESRNIGFFQDANWLDWVILLMTVMLIIWHIVVTVRLVKRHKVSSKPA